MFGEHLGLTVDEGLPRNMATSSSSITLRRMPEADETLIVDDPKLGRVEVRRWHNYHFRKAAKHSMDILRVEVLEPRGRRRQFKTLWLAWLGENRPP